MISLYPPLYPPSESLTTVSEETAFCEFLYVVPSTSNVNVHEGEIIFEKYTSATGISVFTMSWVSPLRFCTMSPHFRSMSLFLSILLLSPCRFMEICRV